MVEIVRAGTNLARPNTAIWIIRVQHWVELVLRVDDSYDSFRLVDADLLTTSQETNLDAGVLAV
jgi:hypothetical protein